MKALLLIDIQTGFCPGGNLAVADGDQVVPIANALIDNGGYDLVVASQDWHPENHGSFASQHPDHLLGAAAMAWEGDELPYEVKGMLRSRANTIEGGTTEVNTNIVAERVLGLPREPDPWRAAAWREVPRG